MKHTDDEGFSIQQANVLGFAPTGFSGFCIYASSVVDG
jgi:hypothetical protein